MNRCRPDQLVCIGFLECHACRGYQAEKRYKSLFFSLSLKKKNTLLKINYFLQILEYIINIG